MEKEILSRRQKQLLEVIGHDVAIRSQFYLTGGTPLAAFYLYHRYSEDLDFFSQNEFDPINISAFFKKNQNELGFRKIETETRLNRNLFFLTYSDEEIKLEFTYFPFERIQTGYREYDLEVDSLIDIATNKLFSIYQRTKARDYIDLYFLLKSPEISLPDLIKKAGAKFETGLNTLQLVSKFLDADKLTDYPRLIIKLQPTEWISFFEEQARSLKKKILE